MRKIDDNERVFINALRGFAIFLMLWAHCVQFMNVAYEDAYPENIIFKTINTFHMPLLMLISGYLFYFSFCKRELGELLVHRTQSLLQPIVFGTVLTFCVTKLPYYVLRGEFGQIINGAVIDNLGGLWFLWSTLAAAVVVAVVCKLVKRTALQIVLLVLGTAAILCFPKAVRNLDMYPYFVAGFYFAKFRPSVPKKVKALRYLTIPLFPVMLGFFEKKHYINSRISFSNQSHWSNEVFRWAIGFVGVICVITVFELICRRFTARTKRPVRSGAFARLGEKSLQVYVLSVPFLSYYLSVGYPHVARLLNFGTTLEVNGLIFAIYTLSAAIAYAFALYWAAKLLERMKLSKLVFGK